MNRTIRTWVEISLSTLEHNYREIRSHLPEQCELLGICKANSYGHGAVRVAQLLQQLGCRWIAVNNYDEAEELRAAGVSTEILLLSPQPANIAVDLVDLDVTQSISSLDYAQRLSRHLAGTEHNLKAHLKLETGMGRTGFDAMDDSHLDDLLAALELPNLDVTGIFTHMAVADEPGDPFNDLQFERFNVVIRELEQRSGKTFRLRHCANSGAVLYYPEMALDMVRPGLLLYGLYPGEDHNGFDLIPALQLRSRVCEITTHRKGDTISYGRTFTCDRDMRLAVLPVGYADGLLRELSGKIDVKIRGHRCRQVGRICMDMCMIDVTDFPDVKVGDIATVFGKDPTATEQAEKAGTISYELLCAVSHRVPRVYVD